MGENLDEWRRDGEGNITLCPFLGYGTAVAAGMVCMVKIDFARTPDQIRTGGESLQLGMSAPQAIELAQALLKMASRIDPSVPPGTKLA